MEEHQIILKFMSGSNDGDSRRLYANGGDGKILDERWMIRIGRLDQCDVSISDDDYVSRTHAQLYHTNMGWWIEDRDSRNGTYITPLDDFFAEIRLNPMQPAALEIGQLFRVGHTWLCLELIRQS